MCSLLLWRKFIISYFRLLDKLPVICPHSDSCSEISQRGILEDHLRYRCEGTLVACQYAGAGCTFRGPNKKVREHQHECQYKKEGKPVLASSGILLVDKKVSLAQYQGNIAGEKWMVLLSTSQRNIANKINKRRSSTIFISSEELGLIWVSVIKLLPNIHNNISQLMMVAKH